MINFEKDKLILSSTHTRITVQLKGEYFRPYMYIYMYEWECLSELPILQVRSIDVGAVKTYDITKFSVTFESIRSCITNVSENCYLHLQMFRYCF